MPTSKTPVSEGPPPQGINPELRQEVDRTYAESDHGSDPMATVSVKKQGPAVWPVIWAVVAVALVLLTIWLVT